MRLLLVTLLWASPLLSEIPAPAQDAAYAIRADDNLFFGTGETSGTDYYDVSISSQPADGVLIKLPYTQKGGSSRLIFITVWVCLPTLACRPKS